MRWSAVWASLVCLGLAGGAAAHHCEQRVSVLDAPVLNAPWSGIPSFGAAQAPSVLAAVAPPLIGGFLGPSVGGAAAAAGEDRRARLTAGLNAMVARGR